MKKSLLIGFLLVLIGIGAFLVYKNMPSDSENEKISQIVSDVVKEDEETTFSFMEEKKESDVTETPTFLANDFQEDGYYYSQLTESKKKIYEEVYQSVISRNEVVVSTFDHDEISLAFNSVLADHPEIFYVSGHTATDSSVNGKLVSCSFVANYTYDKDTVLSRQKQIETAVNQILYLSPKGTSDYEKVKFVYDYLINNTEYEIASEDDQNICSVFLTHKTVCSGYAKAAQLLLNRMNINCIYATGENDKGESHAWNYVFCDGSWYAMDVTWGDQEKIIENASVNANSNQIDYSYFLVDSNSIRNSHFPDKTVLMPICSDNVDNYYVKEGFYIESFDENQIYTIVNNSYFKNEGSVSVRMRDEQLYKQVYDYLITDQKIFDILPGIGSVNYTRNDNIYTITIATY